MRNELFFSCSTGWSFALFQKPQCGAFATILKSKYNCRGGVGMGAFRIDRAITSSNFNFLPGHFLYNCILNHSNFQKLEPFQFYLPWRFELLWADCISQLNSRGIYFKFGPVDLCLFEAGIYSGSGNYRYWYLQSVFFLLFYWVDLLSLSSTSEIRKNMVDKGRFSPLCSFHGVGLF